jgi:hypothetical protein
MLNFPRWIQAISVWFLCLLFIGCAATSPNIPLDKQYKPPSDSAVTATVVGSSDDKAHVPTHLFVRSIEGKRVIGASKAPGNPVRIEPGLRFVTVEFNRGNFVCTANLTFEAKSEARYQIEYATHPDGLLAGSYCDFWLTDKATNIKVTDVIRQPASFLRDQSFIPIILPVRR